MAQLAAAQRRQKIAKIPVVIKNSQHQGLSGKKLLPHQTTAKTSQEHLWACPGKILVARVNAASQGACLVGATWTYAFFWAGRHFTEISFFGRPACHPANVLDPKDGCALKCAAKLGLMIPTQNSTPKQVLAFGLWAWKWLFPLPLQLMTNLLNLLKMCKKNPTGQ